MNWGPYIASFAIYAFFEVIFKQSGDIKHTDARVISRLFGILVSYIYVDINDIRLTGFDVCFICGMWCFVLLLACIDVLNMCAENTKAEFEAAVVLHKQKEERTLKEGEWSAGYYEMCGFGRLVK